MAFGQFIPTNWPLRVSSGQIPLALRLQGECPFLTGNSNFSLTRSRTAIGSP
jgi:hypothetical protein